MILTLPLRIPTDAYLIYTLLKSSTMPSSKGKPTDPELREKLKEGSVPTYFYFITPLYKHGLRHVTDLTPHRDQAGTEQVWWRRGSMVCLEGMDDLLTINLS